MDLCDALNLRLMRVAYNEQMNDLADTLGEMATLAGSAMDKATQSLLQADLVLAEQVISDHDKITDLSAVCEEKAFSLLALPWPLRRAHQALRSMALPVPGPPNPEG